MKIVKFYLASFSFFLNTKTSVATDLFPLYSDKKLLSLFLISDSVSLSCSSGLKEFKTSTL